MRTTTMASTEGPFRDSLRRLVKDYTKEHQHGTALFWCGQLLNLPDLTDESHATAFDADDLILFAETLMNNRHYRRAAHLLQNHGLERSNLQACLLAAQAMFDSKEPAEALEILDKGVDLVDEAQKELEVKGSESDQQLRRRRLSSVYLLKGKILESLDNRVLAAESYKMALSIDVYCSEAFQMLISHQILSLDEEKEMLASLPFHQCGDDREVVESLYAVRLKKYAKPQDMKQQPRILSTIDVFVHEAEGHFYNCDYVECLNLTKRILKEDPYQPECLPIHISCLVELNKTNELFCLAHNLVELYPDWTVAWFSVGLYYFLVDKQDFARRYLNKSTQLDRVFGPAWLAYGHSFAFENEHDQAMAAYFKASQLMKGCHVPLLYIGVEYGLTNNPKLAERFFSQALEIAPEDPFVLHEIGVVYFQNADFKSAHKFMSKALECIERAQGVTISEKWEPLLNNLGHTARKLGNYDQALEYHHRALVLKPLSASTFAAIGFVYSLKNMMIEAIEAFHQALGIRRDDTFSTTMLNNVIEQMVNEEPPRAGDVDELPQFTVPERRTTKIVLDTSASADSSLTDVEMMEESL